MTGLSPVTGDYIIPAPGDNATLVGNDAASGPSVGGNPWVRQRNVQPSEYEQDQVNLKIDAQLSDNHRLSGTFFYSDFPGFDSFPDPGSLVSPFTLKRADRSRVLALSDTQIWSSANPRSRT